jgi:hypothetical protein
MSLLVEPTGRRRRRMIRKSEDLPEKVSVTPAKGRRKTDQSGREGASRINF